MVSSGIEGGPWRGHRGVSLTAEALSTDTFKVLIRDAETRPMLHDRGSRTIEHVLIRGDIAAGPILSRIRIGRKSICLFLVEPDASTLSFDYLAPDRLIDRNIQIVNEAKELLGDWLLLRIRRVGGLSLWITGLICI